MSSIKKALVIGGGIAGPVTALALQKAGIESTVFEAYETSADGVGGVLMVAPNGISALSLIGADDAVRAIGQPITSMVMSDGSGKLLGEFPSLSGVPASQVLWRGDLYRALHDMAVAHGVTFEYGKRLVAADESAAGITARFGDGSTAIGDVLIGADGIRSTVRKLIDPYAPDPQNTGLLGFGGYTDGSAIPGAPGAMHFVLGKRAFMGFWKRPGGDGVWFGNVPHTGNMTAAQARETPASEWLRILREAYADDVPGRDLLRHADPERLVSVGSMEIMPPVPHWHRGRMVLVGDSAHAPSPSSGQGVSIAAESAIQLARCLRDLSSVESAFAAYERLRRPRVEKIAADAAKTNSSKAAGPLAKAMMSLVMPIAMKLFVTPEKMFGPAHRYRIDWEEVVAA